VREQADVTDDDRAPDVSAAQAPVVAPIGTIAPLQPIDSN
jgi:hypothetical protein